MELKGVIVTVLPIESGNGPKGGWQKQSFVMETGDKYPKKICMTLWGQENIDKYDLVEGMTVTAFIELDSREYNGKWYTNVKAWKIQWDEQKRPDFPKKQEPVKEQEWPEQERSSGKWPEAAGGPIDDKDLPF